MATLVNIKNLSRRRIRFGQKGSLAPALYNATAPVLQVDVDDPTVKRDLFRNLGSYAFAPDVIVAKVALTAAAANANGAAFAWQNAGAVPIFVQRVVLDITTPGLATSTLDIGSTSTALGAADVTNFFAAQASSANGTFLSATTILKLAATDFISGTFKTAAGTGIVGNVYIHYAIA